MKANYNNTPKMPRSFRNLPVSEQEQIKDFMTEIVTESVDREVAEQYANLQITWIKLCCVLMHDAFGFGEKRLLQYIANWKRIYKINAKCGDSQTRDKWLDEEMKRCFPKSGFPSDFVESLKDIGS